MTRSIDLWRAVDTSATLVSGSVDQLLQSVRGVQRTRAVAPRLPEGIDGQLLIVDAPLVAAVGLDRFLAAVAEAELRPAAVALAAVRSARSIEAASSATPVLASARPAPELLEIAGRYLGDERAFLQRATDEFRLALAEAALAEPSPAAPAGLLATRLHRGVAVVADGGLASVHARPAGRALAARFSAAFARVLGGGSDERIASERRGRDGLWLLERRIRAGATVWVFDDVPLAQLDGVGADALTLTLRALLRRPPRGPAAESGVPEPAPPVATTARRGAIQETLLAVARANGRVAPAARALGVHRNTVLYRLRAARAELGIDPRRPADALRLLAEEDEPRQT